MCINNFVYFFTMCILYHSFLREYLHKHTFSCLITARVFLSIINTNNGLPMISGGKYLPVKM